MKISLCLSGQPRFFEQTFPFLDKNLLSLNEVDVFIHCWSTKAGYSYPSRVDAPLVEEDFESKLLELYKPKLYLIEEERDLYFGMVSRSSDKNTRVEPCTVRSMFYSLNAANRLKNTYQEVTGTNYDCVVRSRFDFVLQRKIVIKQIQPNLIYYSACANPNVVSDVFMLGSPRVLNLVSSIYTKLTSLSNRGVLFCGDELITDIVREFKLERSPIPAKGFLARDKFLTDRTLRFG